MRRLLVNKPLSEPLTLEEAKQWLRVDHSDDDVLISALITAARELTEARTGRSLIAQTWRVTLDHWPPGGSLSLPVLPVMTISAIRVLDVSGVATILAPTLYQLETGQEPARLRLGDVPAPGRARNGIEIDVVAGYGSNATDCPASLRQAIRLMLGMAYARRGPSETSLRSEQSGRTLEEIDGLLAPYRVFRLFRALEEPMP